MKCANCGSENLVTSLTHHRYTECGLSSVTLIVPVRRCGQCHEEEVIVPRIAQLHRMLAESLCKKPGPLSPEEFRFLRKHLGHSSKNTAIILGVTQETLSRWENGHHPIDSTADRFLRVLAMTCPQTSSYPEQALLAAWKKSKKPRSAKVSFRAPQNGEPSWSFSEPAAA